MKGKYMLALAVGSAGIASVALWPQLGLAQGLGGAAHDPSLDRIVSKNFENVNVNQVFAWLVEQGFSYVASDKSLETARVSMNINHESVWDAARALADALGGHWALEGHVYVFHKNNGPFMLSQADGPPTVALARPIPDFRVETLTGPVEPGQEWSDLPEQGAQSIPATPNTDDQIRINTRKGPDWSADGQPETAPTPPAAGMQDLQVYAKKMKERAKSFSEKMGTMPPSAWQNGPDQEKMQKDIEELVRRITEKEQTISPDGADQEELQKRIEGMAQKMSARAQQMAQKAQGMQPDMNGVGPDEEELQKNIEGMAQKMSARAQQMAQKAQGMQPDMSGVGPDQEELQKNIEGMAQKMADRAQRMAERGQGMNGTGPNMEELQKKMEQMGEQMAVQMKAQAWSDKEPLRYTTEQAKKMGSEFGPNSEMMTELHKELARMKDEIKKEISEHESFDSKKWEEFSRSIEQWAKQIAGESVRKMPMPPKP